eukprot:TRINITY_DN16701_c0_g1_i1.p2 TRINITY_DN16701_c0_g1~~TRINITY_DN16701_c0_g1_i1.p2  ORF type:complete len:268 (-),score=22.93 TRINITY_DN16701_c0_g1_i1:23-826(-)
MIHALRIFQKERFYEESFLNSFCIQIGTQIRDLNILQIQTIVACLGALNYTHKIEFVQKLTDQSTGQLNKLNLSQLIGFMYNLTILQIFDEKWWDEATSNLQKYELTDFSTIDLNRLFLLNQLHKFSTDERLFHLDQFPGSLKSAVSNAWKNNDKKSLSHFQREVHELLKIMGFKQVVLEKRLENGLVVDMLLQDQDRQIVIEVDGIFHFSANQPKHSLGRTVVRNRILQGSGFAVVSIPLYDWVQFESTEAKTQCLNTLLQPYFKY